MGFFVGALALSESGLTTEVAAASTDGAGAAAAGTRRPAARSATQRTGGAYIRPPLFHRLLGPRGSPIGVFGPTLRSKISP